MPRQTSDEKYSLQKPVKVNIVRELFINKYIASFVIVVLSMALALSGEAASLWPIFGASNQLMSAITLLIISLWLLSKNTHWLVAIIPMIFMMIMSLWGVLQVINQQWNANMTLVIVGIILVVMSALLVALGVSVIAHHIKEAKKA